MKVRIYLLFALSLIFGFGLYTDVKADTQMNKENWISWSAHSWYSEDLNVVGFSRYNAGQDNEVIPWYYFGVMDNSRGIVIKHNKGSNKAPTYYYLSFQNTAVLKQKNRVAGSENTYGLNTNTTIIDDQFFNCFPDLQGKTIYRYAYTPFINDIVDNNYDFEVTSSTDLLEQLEHMDYTNPGWSNAGDLPLLSFTLDRKIVPQAALNITTTKLIFNWDYTEKEPYKSSPSNYSFDMMACANFKASPTGVGEIYDADNLSVNPTNQVIISNGGNNISVNTYSFLYGNIGQSVYSKSNKTWNDDSINSATLGYNLYIRCRDTRGTKFSYWKIFKVQAGGYVTSTNSLLTPDGTIVNGNDYEDADDGLDPSNNGVAHYDTDNSSSAQEDPSGEMYSPNANFNIGTMIANLKSIVNSLLDLPNILGQLVTFLPEWLITLLVLSIGMFVVIGLVKTIVG